LNHSEIRRLLRDVGVAPDKRLGQTFLLNRLAAGRIALEAAPGPRENLLEIGPGLGALTAELLAVCRSVTAVEISLKMCRYLSERFGAERLQVVNSDFLKTDPVDLPGYPFTSLAGNLPYSISSPALLRLLEPGFDPVRKAVFMLQKEVAIRVETLDGGKDYGRLSLQLWPRFSVRVLLDVGSGDFYPPPRVESRVIVLTRRTNPLVSQELFETYRKLVKISFSSRRKIILNNLAAVFGRETAADYLRSAGIDSSLRAEQIAPEAFARLAMVIDR